MKYLYFVVLSLIFSFGAQAAFIEGLEDVPVMEGLTQLPNDAITFGNEESRLVEAVLTSESKTFKEVSRFYKNTLPQMGWAYQGTRGRTLVFEREGEVIDISEESAEPLKVRITVKSKL